MNEIGEGANSEDRMAFHVFPLEFDVAPPFRIDGLSL